MQQNYCRNSYTIHKIFDKQIKIQQHNTYTNIIYWYVCDKIIFVKIIQYIKYLKNKIKGLKKTHINMI